MNSGSRLDTWRVCLNVFGLLLVSAILCGSQPAAWAESAAENSLAAQLADMVDSSTSIAVSTDKNLYHIGETVCIFIVNNSDSRLFVSYDRVEKLCDSVWLPVYVHYAGRGGGCNPGIRYGPPPVPPRQIRAAYWDQNIVVFDRSVSPPQASKWIGLGRYRIPIMHHYYTTPSDYREIYTNEFAIAPEEPGTLSNIAEQVKPDRTETDSLSMTITVNPHIIIDTHPLIIKCAFLNNSDVPIKFSYAALSAPAINLTTPAGETFTLLRILHQPPSASLCGIFPFHPYTTSHDLRTMWYERNVNEFRPANELFLQAGRYKIQHTEYGILSNVVELVKPVSTKNEPLSLSITANQRVISGTQPIQISVSLTNNLDLTVRTQMLRFQLASYLVTNPAGDTFYLAPLMPVTPILPVAQNYPAIEPHQSYTTGHDLRELARHSNAGAFAQTGIYKVRTAYSQPANGEYMVFNGSERFTFVPVELIPVDLVSNVIELEQK